MMTKPFRAASTELRRGVTLLEASAGTGKTYSLTTVAVRLLIESPSPGAPPFVESIDRLLMVTFTRAATDEMKHRLRSRLKEAERCLKGELDPGASDDEWLVALAGSSDEDREESLRRIQRARRDVDLARVQTIHSFCTDVLRDGAFEAGLPIDLGETTDTSALLHMAAADVWRALHYEGGCLVAVGLQAKKATLDGRGDSYLRNLGVVRLHPHALWIPELPDLAQAQSAVLAAAESLDFAAIKNAMDDFSARKKCNKPGNESVIPALEVLSSGFDVQQLAHCRALGELSSLADGKAITKRDKRAYQEFESMPWLQGVRELVDKLESFQSAIQRGFLSLTMQRFEELKQRQGLIDFDDLISQAWKRLDAPESGAALVRRIAGRFDAVLVDEFQDTDAVQWKIFRRLFAPETGNEARHVLMLVGDPKQAIYGFRGADVFAYFQARDDAPTHYTLPRNYRSHPALVRGVNALFGRRAQESFLLRDLVFEPVEPGRGEAEPPLEGMSDAPLQIVTADSVFSTRPSFERWATTRLVKEIQGLLSRPIKVKGHVLSAGHIAVLVQSHSQSRRVMKALREQGINAVLAKSGDIHDTEAMREWRAVLDSLLDPLDQRKRRRACVTRLWGTVVSELLDDDRDDEAELWVDLRHRWFRWGFASMASHLMRMRATAKRLLAEDDGERMITDLRHAFEVLQRAEHDLGLGPEALVRWLPEAARQKSSRDEERQLRLDRDREAVQVVTVFGSKGLEYEVVFVPFASYEGDIFRNLPVSLHLDRDGARVEALTFSKDEPEIADQARLEKLSESQRLFYVALTRARSRCVLFVAEFSGKNQGAHSAPVQLLARPDVEPGDADRGSWLREAVEALEENVDWIQTIEARVPEWEDVALAVAPAAGSVPAVVADSADDQLLRVRPFPGHRRPALRPWRVSSYTNLVRRLQDLEDEVFFVDQADPALEEAAESQVPSGIFAFARGARAGSCLHELLECSDFARAVDDSDRLRVTHLLAKFNLLKSGHRSGVDPVEESLALIERVRGEDVYDGGFRFADLDRRHRLDEWKFTLPLNDFRPSDLADVIASTWNDDGRLGPVVARVRHLEDEALRGYLGGVVDLVCEHEGRWYVVDWKSNDLGTSIDDYDESRVWAAMVEHDYVVQALFYLTALHRHLGRSLPGYDFDRNVAGAGYVFLRGLAGRKDRGWAFMRPPRETIEAIDGLFRGDA